MAPTEQSLDSTDDSQGKSRSNGLDRALTTLRRHAMLILSCVIVATAATVAVSLLQTKQYTASASLLFRDPGYSEALFGTDAAPSTVFDTAREAATNAQLVGLRVIAARTAAAMDAGLSTDQVDSKVEISTEGQSDVVSVSATDPSPARARTIANTFARQFISFRAEADRRRLLRAKALADAEYDSLSPSEREGARGEQLSRGAERLGILASLQTGNAELVQAAELPKSPSSPKPVRNGVIGAIFGLVVGVFLAFVIDRLNRRIREPEDAAAAFGLPLLANVPESKAISDEAYVDPSKGLPFSESESYRTLYASLRYFNIDRRVRSVLITSSSAQVGKSTTAWNLARTAATSTRVVLVEADLRNPTKLINRHGGNDGGLTALLSRQIGIDEATVHVAIAGGNGSRPVNAPHGLDVIVSGPTPPNPAELLESKAMSELLEELSRRYDLVVLDAAPPGLVSDAYPLIRQVDGVIVVARMGHTTLESARVLREQLEMLEAAPLGIVANRVSGRSRDAYGYGYYGSSG